jgi:tRNA1Val (adenine37-N6)-methyltransferase
MSAFRFRQFTVSHSNSTMKVGADAVLLGALTVIGEGVKTILDVGTGCGIIALMAAQRSHATVDAIDIDQSSIVEAGINFQNSPWNGRLRAIHTSVQDFSKLCQNHYDLIVSNPPFFQNSLLPKNPKLQLAKHNRELDFERFLTSINMLLSKTGKLAVILPVNESDIFLKQASLMELYLNESISIIPKSGKIPHRKILVLSRNTATSLSFREFVLLNNSGKYSAEYIKFTSEFHPEEYFSQGLTSG